MRMRVLVGEIICMGLLWGFIGFCGSGSSSTGCRSSRARGSPHGVLLVLLEIVYSVTDPPIKALRRVIPPLRLGNVALDLSFLLVLIGGLPAARVNPGLLRVPPFTRRRCSRRQLAEARYCSTDRRSRQRRTNG